MDRRAARRRSSRAWPPAAISASRSAPGSSASASAPPSRPDCSWRASRSPRLGSSQRVFALIELQLGVTAFLVAPVVLYLAVILAPRTAAGISDAVWICFGVGASGVVAALVVFLAGGVRLRVPDLERWQEEGEPAWGPFRPDLLATRDLGDGRRPSSRGHLRRSTVK